MKDPIKTTIAWYSNSAEQYKSLRSDLIRDEENRTYFLEHLSWKKILDIWCAHGRDVCEFFKNNKEVSGIDLTPEFITMAKKSCPKANIQLMDMRKLTFEDKTFDGIRSCASLLHIPKKEIDITLEWFHRVLKKWWLLYIGVKEWDGEWFDERDRYFAYRKQDELEQKLQQHKFSIKKSNKSNNNNRTWINIFAIAE